MRATREPCAARTLALAPVLACLLAAAFAPRAVAQKSGDPIAFVVNARNPVSALTSAELRRIYLGDETRWAGKSKITILVLPAGRVERRVLFDRLLNMSDDAFVRHWISKVFQGDATSGPKTAGSPTSMEKLVTGLPDAIGFLSHGQISASGNLKVLRIDGKAPGETGYPFTP